MQLPPHGDEISVKQANLRQCKGPWEFKVCHVDINGGGALYVGWPSWSMLLNGPDWSSIGTPVYGPPGVVCFEWLDDVELLDAGPHSDHADEQPSTAISKYIEEHNLCLVTIVNDVQPDQAGAMDEGPWLVARLSGSTGIIARAAMGGHPIYSGGKWIVHVFDVGCDCEDDVIRLERTFALQEQHLQLRIQADHAPPPCASATIQLFTTDP